jgi:hypothetical protein
VRTAANAVVATGSDSTLAVAVALTPGSGSGSGTLGGGGAVNAVAGVVRGSVAGWLCGSVAVTGWQCGSDRNTGSGSGGGWGWQCFLNGADRSRIEIV